MLKTCVNSSTLVLLFIFFAVSVHAQLPAPVPNKPDVSKVKVDALTTVQTPPGVIYNSSTRVNYVRVREGLAKISDEIEFDAAGYERVKEATQYLDGLGRPLQTVSKQATSGANPKDVVTPVIYDEFGRETYKYLSYAQSGNNSADGSFKMNPFAEQDNFYKNVYKDANQNLMLNGEQYLWSKTEYEPSPLNRVSKLMVAGNSWAGSGKGITQQYLFNTGADDAVQKWNITFNLDPDVNIPSTSGVYDPGTLFKNVSRDEENPAVVEYTDKQGHLILKKVQIGSGIPANYPGYDNWLCTYYVYDDLGRLRFVIPPKAVDAIRPAWILSAGSNVVNELCFRYEYDKKQRLIAKKVPGAGWVYLVYDQRDRLVFTQDANLGQKGQWMTTLYDALNRAVITGIIDYGQGRETLQTYQDNQNPDLPPVPFLDNVEVVLNPVPSGSTFTALTITDYDNYPSSGNAFTDTYNAKLDKGTNLLTAEEAIKTTDQRNVLTSGMVTSTRVRVLEDPANLASGKWLSSVNYYGEKGRVSQVVSENDKGGKDIMTYRYDFTGHVISSYLVHNNPQSAAQTLRIATRTNYEHTGKPLETFKTINDETSKEVSIAKNEYDELGQLKTRKLGRQRNPDGSYGSLPVETLDYNYNIRGWLKGINAAYSHPELTGSAVNRWFGMELNYDWGSEPGKNLFNGNISSTTWRSKGDDVKRAYGFSYDMASRIMSADFSERAAAGNVYVDNAAINFDMVMSNGTPEFTGYDANGNIKGLTQWGLKFDNSAVIDQLQYDYYPNTNKLSAVSEVSPAIKHKLGDFTDNNAAGNDYGYDLNGNLTADLNKGLIGNGEAPALVSKGGAIEYNHLNLPWKISMKRDDNSTSKGYITYRYDAAGNKLGKTVHEEGVPQDKVTDYISGIVYEQDILRFIPHEEGRIRLTDNAGVITPNYDYFIKDHLGNVRIVLTDEVQMNQYPPLTFEGNPGSAEVNEQKLWEDRAGLEMDVTGNRVQKPGFDTSGNHSMLVRKSTGSIGAGKLLKVMSGDRLHTSVDYYSQCSTCNSSKTNGLASLTTSLLSALVNSSSATALTKSNSTAIANVLITNPEAAGFFTPESAVGASTQAPRAYLHVLLFDEQFRFDAKASYVQQIGSEAGTIARSGASAIEVVKNGFAYVYFSNESEEFVYFDNFLLTHERGPLLEETHYYPFGLTMQGISSKAAGGVENKYKFNSATELQNKEFSDGSGMELYDAMFRMQDPQLGRFWQIDPLTMTSTSATPYHYASNNPILYNDPFGLDTVRVNGEGSHQIKVAQGDVLAWTIGKTTSYYSYDPGNENAVGGFVGAGMDEGTMQSVTITGRKGDNTSAWGLGVEWLTGSGPRDHNFRAGDPFTRMLQKHGHIANTKSLISSGIAQGSVDLNTKYYNNYGLGGLSGIPKYIRDYSTLMTGGLTGNIAVTFLGSYKLQYEVVSVDEQSGTAQVQFYVSNNTTIASGLRPPVLGYTSAWNNTVGKSLNSLFSSGPLSRTTQSVQWTETIKWR